MKFTCSQQSLSKALNTVSKAVTNRTTIPILKGILLKADTDGTLTLSASDLDLSIEKKIDVHVEEEGSIVVLSKLFSDIIRKLPNGDIFIEEKENNTILIKTASSEFTIVGLEADEFPNINDLDEQSGKISFQKEIFKDMVKKTAFAASSDESKGILIGVLFEVKPESVSMVALDGFRMAVARRNADFGESKKIVVSAKILNEVNKIISETEDESDIDILLCDKKAVVLMDQTKIVIRLLEGEFIKYKDILPQNNQTKVKIERSGLLDSIERASLLAKEGKNNLIKLEIENNLLTITSKSEEGKVKEEVIMEKTGEDLEIGFNSKYVIDVLKAVEDEKVIIELNTSTTPCLVKPVEGNGFEYLILPVRIASNY